MAHEELKALYEIDSQHSDTPWEFWEADYGDGWAEQTREPSWWATLPYRRKTGAPVWPVSDDAEDARKWRELEAFYRGNGIMDTAKKFLEIIEPKPALIQGYTAEQWQAIIDGKFLCEFSDADWHIENNYADRIVQVLTGITDGKFTGNDYHWPYCRPLRIKGVRQPWFGGEFPVDPSARVSYVLRDGYKDQIEAGRIRWEHKAVMSDIVEFIEL